MVFSLGKAKIELASLTVKFLDIAFSCFVILAECVVSKYSEWSECNVSCGKGLRSRTRKYLNETAAKLAGCDRQLVSKEMCLSSVPICP